MTRKTRMSAQATSIGRLLTRARKSAAIDQKELARRTATAPRTVSRWEMDKCEIPEARQLAILAALTDAAPEHREALARAFDMPSSASAANGDAMTIAPQPAGGAEALRQAVFAWAEFLDVSPRKVKIVLLEAFAIIEERKLRREEVMQALAPPGGVPRWRR